jgi:hypothetical protein
MRQPAVLSLALALGLAAAIALASCGGGEDAELLPGATAAEISENLDTVKRLADEGECAGAAGAAEQVSVQVEALSGVDPELKQALERGAARLGEVIVTCEETGAETLAPSTEDTEETTRVPPGQEKKEEKEREKEEREAEKEAEREAKEAEREEREAENESEPPTGPAPSEDGGTGASGGVSPAEPAEPGAE